MGNLRFKTKFVAPIVVIPVLIALAVNHYMRDEYWLLAGDALVAWLCWRIWQTAKPDENATPRSRRTSGDTESGP